VNARRRIAIPFPTLFDAVSMAPAGKTWRMVHRAKLAQAYFGEDRTVSAQQ
jgi:hypothetical protein